MKHFVIIGVLFLAGCAGAQAPDERSGLREFVRADITSALLSATANEDRLAAMCWRALLEHMESQPKSEKARRAGVLSAYQRVRNFRRRPRGIDEDVRIGCAPMVSESRARIFRKIRRLATGL